MVSHTPSAARLATCHCHVSWQEETQFLGSIKDALGMEQEKCDELVKEQQVHT